ncbi:hypothetical protein ACEWPM_013515 [Roseovarius sp. S4756]
MLSIFAKSFMTAARQPEAKGHQGRRSRYDSRREAEIEAHLTARRRD